MDANIELMQYLYQNSEMGVHTLTKLLNELNDKDNKIKGLVSKHLKIYEKFLKESKNIIKKNKIKIEKNSCMAKMGSSMGIRKEVKCDNSDTSMAHMIIEGVTMGLVDIESKIKDFSEVVDKDILSLAKNYQESLKEQLGELKEYL